MAAEAKQFLSMDVLHFKITLEKKILFLLQVSLFSVFSDLFDLLMQKLIEGLTFSFSLDYSMHRVHWSVVSGCCLAGLPIGRNMTSKTFNEK